MIYFIQDTRTRAIKIGTSHNPVARLKALQTAHPSQLVLLAVMDGGAVEEHALHREFTRLQGEWFQSTPELLSFIRQAAMLMPHSRAALKRAREALPIPSVVDELTPIDLATCGYDKRLIWNVALVAINERDGEYKYSSQKIAKFLVTRGTKEHRAKMFNDIQRMVLTIRSMPRTDLNRLLSDAPAEVQALESWAKYNPRSA